ncbi:peptidylprolyl isomerase [Alsobacter sp. SYSU M60028]|uniref:Parvulin-like PPIase n=1 Tax=Alsobacter ponti TaxID=2962936 RepID=A0ABT1LEN3_9HYPH|nr:peptidylprolyl isomerase [Alsobacter ponti]MCP8939566.1 peptidylprolyl isomerase [Alsobacter ponti]
MTTSSPASSCAVKPAISAKPKTVSVNGVAISRSAIAQEVQNHPASKPIEAWQAAARALVVRELLLQEARRIGLSPEPRDDGEGRRETDEEALVRQLVEREVKAPRAGDDECRRYFEQNRARFRTPALHEVRHILIAADPADRDARDQARVHAEILIDQIRRNPASFGQLAGQISACPSGKTGGSLGQIGPGQTVPEFEQALERLNEGEVAARPVETRYGLHIVWLDRRIAGRDLPLEMVRERIAEWLGEKARRMAIRHYIASLAGRAEIVGVDLGVEATPLMQ